MVKGEMLVVTFSRFDRVKMPYEANLPPDDMTKDFSGVEYQKFRRSGSATQTVIPFNAVRYWNEDLKRQNMKKIMKPTSTIHISGVQVAA
jgi:hypothetical protein